MSAGWGVGASTAGGGGTAPDALAAVAVPVDAVRAVWTTVAVGRRPAPLAMLLVINVFVNPVWAIRTAMSV